VPFGDASATVYGMAIGELDGDGFPDSAARRIETPKVFYFSLPSKGATRTPV